MLYVDCFYCSAARLRARVTRRSIRAECGETSRPCLWTATSSLAASRLDASLRAARRARFSTSVAWDATASGPALNIRFGGARRDLAAPPSALRVTAVFAVRPSPFADFRAGDALVARALLLPPAAASSFNSACSSTYWGSASYVSWKTAAIKRVAAAAPGAVWLRPAASSSLAAAAAAAARVSACGPCCPRKEHLCAATLACSE